MKLESCSLDSSLQTPSIISFDCEGSRFDLFVANSLETRKQSYKFMYDTYSNNGLGTKQKDGLWYSLSELLPTTVTIVIYKNNKIVASLSSIVDSEYGMPVDDSFPNEIKKRREYGHRMTEVYSLGIHVSPRESNEVLCKLLNVITIINYYVFKVTQTLITVVPGHSAFYREKLLFNEHPQLGFHRKTGVSCMLLTHDHPNSIESNIHLKKRTLFEKFYAKEETAKIVDSLLAAIRPITREEFKYFYYLKADSLNANDWSESQKKYIDHMLKG